jgi:hypothetical protein
MIARERGAIPLSGRSGSRQKGGALTVAELPDLVVPRRDGFWRVGVRHYCDLSERNGGSEDDSISKHDVLFSVPVSKRATVEGLVAFPKTDQRVCTASHISIKFLNPEYLSIEQGEEFNCGAHPDWSGSFTVSRTGDAERKAISFGSLKGLDPGNEYRHASAHALIENLQGLGDAEKYEEEYRSRYKDWSTMSDEEKVSALDSGDDGCFPNHNDTEWYITRRPRRWAALGAIPTHRLCGTLVKFELPLPAIFGTSNTPPVSLESIRKRLPGALDAVWSPRQETLLVLVRDQTIAVLRPQNLNIEVFHPLNLEIGTPVLTIRLHLMEEPVMAEWALGANVDRWTTVLEKIRESGFQEPLMVERQPAGNKPETPAHKP